MIRIKPTRLELKQDDAREYENAKLKWVKEQGQLDPSNSSSKNNRDARNSRIGVKKDHK
jgi:hypothetical protein